MPMSSKAWKASLKLSSPRNPARAISFAPYCPGCTGLFGPANIAMLKQ
jgi:hypothetical protein